MTKELATTDLPKRKLIKKVGITVAASPFMGLLACGGGSGNSSGASNTSNDTESAPTGDSDWANGGTAAMQATFPPSDPFVSGLGNLCSVTSAFTLGPCYYNVNDYREDISDGELGVPMALVLKLVDINCNPISGADIEIWFCNREGIYSGDTSNSSDASSFNSGFCTDNNAAARSSSWFRGVQTTNSDGLVYYKACFPGWYPSRTTHIHFKVVKNGLESLVFQFAFADDLSNDIYINHEDYTGAAKDTSNSRDTVFNASTVDEYLIETERQFDGSMLDYKAIQLN